MAWIKRNLYFVISVVVGLGVTGYCGYLVYSALNDNAAAADQYASSKSRLDELQHKSPFPSPENIEAAQQDAGKLQAVLAEFRKPFATFPSPPTMDDREFTERLQKYIAHFGKAATNAGVGLDANYAFSFSQQVNNLNHPAECIQPWLDQLQQIEAILNVLYAAKINYLERIKRSPVGDADAGGDDYVQFATNVTPWGVVSPYKVEFRAFSSELANVLAGVASSSNCLIIKAVYVSPSHVALPKVDDTDSDQPQPVQQQQFYQPRPNPYAPNPYGPGGFGRSAFGPGYGGRGEGMGPGGYQFRRPTPPPQAPAPEAPLPPSAPETILTENPLFVTLYIDVLKLKAVAQAAVPVAHQGGPGPGPGPGMHGRGRRGP